MVYVVIGKSECLLGRKDGINLGIITINEKGAAPDSGGQSEKAGHNGEGASSRDGEDFRRRNAGGD